MKFIEIYKFYEISNNRKISKISEYLYKIIKLIFNVENNKIIKGKVLKNKK